MNHDAPPDAAPALAEPAEPANAAQTSCWNEQAGPLWARRQEELDAQLAPIGDALLEALGLRRGERVLDVGCGAGATTLAIADRVAPGEVLGLDVSAPLLARAAERARGLTHVQFVRADAQTHRHEGARFDVVSSRFGVMFFDDPIAAFANLGDMLVPGGRLGFVCWRSVRENPLFTLPLEAATPWLAQPPPMPPPDAPGPFAFADSDRVRALLEAAGWAQIEIAPHDVDVAYAGGPDLERAVDLALEIGPLSRAMPGVESSQHAPIRAAVREAFARHLGPRGVVLPAASWLVTARRA